MPIDEINKMYQHARPYDVKVVAQNQLVVTDQSSAQEGSLDMSVSTTNPVNDAKKNRD